jgi:hypothetical protein
LPKIRQRYRSQSQVIPTLPARPAHCTTQKGVTLKIEKTPGDGRTIIKLIARIRAEHLDELKAQVTANLPEIVLELGEVSLVDPDAVRFLSAC